MKNFSLYYLKLVGHVCAAAVAALAAGRAEASVVTFNDRGDYNAAVAGLSITDEEFNNPIPAAPIIVFDSGIVAENVGITLDPTDNSVAVSEFAQGYVNAVNDGSDIASDFIIWTFPEPVVAFGFDLFNAAFSDLQVSFDGGDGVEDFIFGADVMGVSGDGFVGFLASEAFSEIVFSNANPASTDSFSIRNLTFAGPPSEVPLPAAALLFAAGIAGLSFVRRPRKHEARRRRR